ncbi:uncharacterized protein LOC144496850 [Mustelus asterias]
MCWTRHCSQFTDVFLLTSCFMSLCASGSSVTVTVHQREVNGTVNQSVLLPVSYSTPLHNSSLRLEWSLFPGNTALLTLIRSNCSPDPDRSGYKCSVHLVTSPSYQDRVHLYPDNGSLLLRNVQTNDSGVYVISVYINAEGTTRKGNVTLTVYNGTDSETSTATVSASTHISTTTGKVENVIMIGVSAAAVSLLIILVCLHLLMTKKHTGCQRQQDLALMEISAQPIGETRQDLAENEGSLSNGSELTYSFLQWSGPRLHPNTHVRPQETIYALAQRTDCS